MVNENYDFRAAHAHPDRNRRSRPPGGVTQGAAPDPSLFRSGVEISSVF